MPKPKGSKKVSITCRIVRSMRFSAFHQLMFNQMPGKEYPGILVRLLLDEYFNNRLPTAIKLKFEEEVRKVKAKQDQILAQNHKPKEQEEVA